MASYKSQFNPPRRSDIQTPYARRAPGTRLPQRSVTPTSSTSQIPAPSKLQKRRLARDEQTYTSSGAANHNLPVPKSSMNEHPRLLNSKPSTPTPTPHGSSGMPIARTNQHTATSRLPRMEISGNTRTPSLVSGSSASTIDSPRSTLLRRKPSNIGMGTGRQTSKTRDGSMSSQEEMQPLNGIPGSYRDPFSETVLGISLPPSSSILAHSEIELDSPEEHIHPYDAPHQLVTEGLALPTPQYAQSATPSTRYSESPGPFSVTSTPTSMSSHSPGLALSTKSSIRARQASPMQTRPPVTRRKPDENHNLREQRGLSSVRESTTSSSSTSTVMADIGRQKERSSKTRLPAPPPSPPAHAPQMYFTISDSQIDLSSPEVSKDGPHSSQPSNHTSRVQAPPELAHLADPPQLPKGDAPRPKRPRRPSRDGTPEIIGLREPSPIVQSNMTSFPSPHKRTSSTDSKISIVPNAKSRFGIPSKPSSRGPSPNPSMASGFPPTSRVPTHSTTPDMQKEADKARAQTLPTPAPSPSKSSRFGFFSRRTKTDPASSTLKPDRKLQRKGPVAGTGHEGYGKYSFRGRSGSSTSGSVGRSASAGTTTESLNRTPSSRKSSVTSTTSSDMDDFFLERLNPVAIRGTGSSTELSRSPEPMRSGSSMESASRPNYDSRKASDVQGNKGFAHAGTNASKPTLLPSAISDPVCTGSPMKRLPVKARRPSDSDDDSKRNLGSSLAARRASRISQLVDGKSTLRLPQTISTADGSATGRLGSATSGKALVKESKSSRSQAANISEGKEGNWLKSKKASAVAKPARKWNFFQRAHATPKAESPVVENVAAATARPPPSRSVAHYALMDPPEGLDLDDLEQIMQEADSAPEDPIPLDSDVTQQDNEPKIQQDRQQSMLLPPAPLFSTFTHPSRSASPKVSLRRVPEQDMDLPLEDTLQSFSFPATAVSLPEPGDDLYHAASPPPALAPLEPLSPLQSFSSPAPPPTFPPPRPNRLPQVGRIPQVVSSRDQTGRPPSRSFSRPFNPNGQSRTSVDSSNSIIATAGSIEHFPVLQGLNALAHGTAIAGISPSAEESIRRSEFFKFPPRKDSEVSYSSSSGVWSFPATSGTAVVPERGAPQSEDEIWNEYDDLIDEVLSPGQPRKRPSRELVNDISDIKNAKLNRQPPPEPLPLRPKVSHTSSHSGSSIAPANPSLHLRRSRLLAVLHSAQTPTSPMSMNEFFAGYGERNLSVVDPVTGRLSFPSTKHTSISSGPQNRPSSTRSSLPVSLSLSARQSKATLASNSDRDRDSASTNRYRDTRLMEIAESQNDGLVSMANLRFGALMTSKWLSFGRVLFSPAHFELKDPAEDRVLVIDGLGKDWSYYCALTYPEATIYNLGPGASSNTSTSSEPWSTLRNHRHIAHPSLGSPFPFPKGFFACAVLRFPPALSSSDHRSILSECKRVLRPGGHLELSVLDLDLVNMGNRARRAVRGLKVKMQIADEHVSLRNISDEVMGGLGRRGFTGCYRCFVGVPVGGRLPAPESENDDNKSAKSKRKGSSASSRTRITAPKAPKPELSFSDLLNSPTGPSEAVDDGITEMVAKVGRWWYSRCYESTVLPEAGEPGAAHSGNLLESSIWRDEALIRECEKHGTSFRLLIGYAQKPEVGVRRTVSV